MINVVLTKPMRTKQAVFETALAAVNWSGAIEGLGLGVGVDGGGAVKKTRLFTISYD